MFGVIVTRRAQGLLEFQGFRRLFPNSSDVNKKVVVEAKK
ncbi:uncharacterized protein G2W53_001766 [Senna tora]|uniref:Uncharacterized protein n=1 Tax=Senna tora TaxID=362788 RepID=A0A835CKL3_9FABA|nr:uncharacterized protein G2W53_001766 [Senna tora]